MAVARFTDAGMVVTGGSRGIGRAIVLAATEEGAKVVFCARTGSDSAAREVVDEVARRGTGEAHFIAADVATEDDVERLFDRAVDVLPNVDVVVNNAGSTHDALLVSTTLEAWNAVLATNLRGPFLVCRRGVEELVGSGGGRIVNVSSFAANGLVGQGAYASAKSALLSLTRSIAKEYGRRGVSCNAVLPGFVSTNMTAALSPEARRARERLSPEDRFATPEEVADAVLFLASEEASFLNGDVLYVAGGAREVPHSDRGRT